MKLFMRFGSSPEIHSKALIQESKGKLSKLPENQDEK